QRHFAKLPVECVHGAQTGTAHHRQRLARVGRKRRCGQRQPLYREGRHIAGIREGFYVTELMGFGANIVTGDYSRGAAGLWIRNGELAFPVSEVTIAGNLSNMLQDLEFIGSDLEFRGSTAAPTLCIGEMTVGG